MITPEEFPYISSIYVNDCYAYQNFNIELTPNKPFSHLILTGKNGSGKSTILKNLWFNLSKYTVIGKNYLRDQSKFNPQLYNSENFKQRVKNNDFDTFFGKGDAIVNNFERLFQIKLLNYGKSLEIGFNQSNIDNLWQSDEFILHFFQPIRKFNVLEVKNPISSEEFNLQIQQNPKDGLAMLLKQYLVNKKVKQAFNQIKGDSQQQQLIHLFFEKLQNIFGGILEDETLKLEFDDDKYDFLIQSKGRDLSFNDLADGFSAFISIVLEILVRVDIAREANNTYEPCGIVLIDEPETHLHLSLQYQVLPILTTLFPNIQFIVATHSPAVISSIKNVTVFDLTSKEKLSDEVIGKSFSELMVAHFGLDNEFSDLADDIFDKVNDVLRTHRKDIKTRNEALKKLLLENEKFISPAMRFELKSKISEIE